MKSVFSTQDLLIIGHLRNLLVNEGIPCEVETPFLAAAKGDVPVTDCWSRLWVTSDEDFERALAVIQTALEETSVPTEVWTCTRCGESGEGQFETCWQCGAPRFGGDR